MTTVTLDTTPANRKSEPTAPEAPGATRGWRTPHMTTPAILAATWIALAIPFAVLIGRAVRLADQRDTCVCCDDEAVEVAA